MVSAEASLWELGIQLPQASAPFGAYVEAVQTGERRIAVVQRIGTIDFISTGAMAALCILFKVKEKWQPL